MSLPGDGHTIDLSQAENPEQLPDPASLARNQVGLVHIAFRVASYQALREAYESLPAHGIHVELMMPRQPAQQLLHRP